MSIEFFEGDVLVAGGLEYQVRRVEKWEMTRQSQRSFSHMATLSAQIKRTPSVVPGSTIRLPATLQETIYAAMPLDPLDAETKRSFEQIVDAMAVLKQTIITDGAAFWRLIVEEIKK